MELLKEAIFDDDEIELLINICGASTGTKEIAEIAKRSQQMLIDKMPHLKLAQSLAEAGGSEAMAYFEKLMDDLIKAKVEERAKQLRSILNKLHLYKNCKLQKD